MATVKTESLASKLRLQRELVNTLCASGRHAEAIGAHALKQTRLPALSAVWGGASGCNVSPNIPRPTKPLASPSLSCR
jgi:hypothetical protein